MPGKTADASVAQLLGATPKPIRCYDSLGVFRPKRDDALIEQPMAKRFDAIMVKIDDCSARAGLADLRSITDPDVELMTNYNQSLTRPVASPLLRPYRIQSNQPASRTKRATKLRARALFGVCGRSKTTASLCKSASTLFA